MIIICFQMSFSFNEYIYVHCTLLWTYGQFSWFMNLQQSQPSIVRFYAWGNIFAEASEPPGPYRVVLLDQSLLPGSKLLLSAFLTANCLLWSDRRLRLWFYYYGRLIMFAARYKAGSHRFTITVQFTFYHILRSLIICGKSADIGGYRLGGGQCVYNCGGGNALLLEIFAVVVGHCFQGFLLDLRWWDLHDGVHGRGVNDLNVGVDLAKGCQGFKRCNNHFKIL